MLLGLDGGLDDESVEGVRNQRDDQVVLADLVFERRRVGYIERDGARVLEALGESFGAVKGTAG
jgi:pentose-5-phosphate-3-epimerase